MKSCARIAVAVFPVVIILQTVDELGADPPPKPLTVATWNLEWFFDEYAGDNYAELARKQAAPSREEWEWKRNGVADAIAEMKPTIIALQEVENQRVLFYLTQRLKRQHQLDYRIAFIQGTDYYTEQDVGILYRSGLVQFCRREQSREMWESKKYYGVQKHLMAKFQWGTGDRQQTLHLVTVHFRAMPKAASIRQRQARLIRYWIEDLVSRGENVVVLGDFNTDLSIDDTSPESEMGVLRALNTDSPEDDLVDLHTYLPEPKRDTHLSAGKQFDRILVSRSLMIDRQGRRDFVFKSINQRKDLVIRGTQDKTHWDTYYHILQSERDLSDHYPIIATIESK